MNKNNQRGISTIIIVIIVALFVIGGAVAVIAYINNNQSDIQDVVEEAVQEQSQQMTDEYPDLYLQAGLPQYPNSELTKKRQGSNLNDGVQVTIETQDSIETAKSFFDTEMENRGFALPNDIASANEFAYFGIYKDGNKKFTITITKIEDTSNNKIHINYSE